MAITIVDWDKHYETNRTRVLKALNWVPMPNRHDGDGYTILLDHPNGAAHFGAWCALVQVASKCTPRGTLIRRSGDPHDAASLCRMTRIPESVWNEALPILSSMGWIDGYSDTTYDRSGTVVPESGTAVPGGRQRMNERMNERRGEGPESPPPSSLTSSGLVIRAPEETPVSKPNEKADGAAGALDGAAARPEEDGMPSDTPSPPEPMRPEHLAELEARAATGDRFALEALRRARHDGRLPNLPHPPAGNSTAPAPISPAGEKAGAPVEPERAQCEDDVFADDETGGDDDARD